MSCYSFLRNVTDLQKDDFTAYQNRFLKDVKGLTVPFGAEVEYKTSSPKGLDKLHTFGAKTLSGAYVGYDQKASGDYLVADWKEIEQTR